MSSPVQVHCLHTATFRNHLLTDQIAAEATRNASGHLPAGMPLPEDIYALSPRASQQNTANIPGKDVQPKVILLPRDLLCSLAMNFSQDPLNSSFCNSLPFTIVHPVTRFPPTVLEDPLINAFSPFGRGVLCIFPSSSLEICYLDRLTSLL